jgi:hypothetical protein
LTDVVAYPLGDPAQPGLSRMMTLVVVTRLHNTAAAAAGMRRGLDYALRFAQVRQVGGQPLLGNPLHRATLGSLEADAQAAFALAAHAFGLLGRVEVDHDTAAEAELRLVAPLAKLVTGKLAVASAAEYLECFGGAGYLEDTGLARLLRDAQVLPIWEGTTNVLSVDVLRAIAHGEGSAQVLARIEDAGQRLTGAPAKRLSDYLAGLRERIAGAGSNPRSAAVQAGARELALDLGHALAAALLVEQATEPAAKLDTAGGHPADHDSARATLASSVWLRSRLFHEATADIAGELVTPPRHS